MTKLVSFVVILFALVSCDSMAHRSIASATKLKGCAQLLGMMSRTITFNITIENYRNSYLKLAKELDLFMANPGDPIRLIKTNDNTIKYYKELSDRVGVPFRIEKAHYTYKGVRLEYDQLLLLPNTDNPALIERLTEGLNVKGIYLEHIFTNLNRIGGFYKPATSTITLKMRYLDDIWSGNISKVLKHELSHAQFESLRLRGRRSIYSNLYFSSKSKKLTNDVYSDVMSAEELYNHVGGPYWVLQAKDVYKNNANYILIDLEEIKANLKAAEYYPLRIETLSSEFSSTIDQIKRAKGSLASDRVRIEHDHIVILDADARQLHTFIDDEKKAFTIRYISALQNYNPKNLETEKELKLALVELLGEIEKEQRMLNKVAREIRPQVRKCQDLTQEILADLDSKEVLTKFNALRKELRSLANMPREHFKGFVGRLL